MSPLMIGAIGVGALLVLFVIGVPIAFSMAIVGLIGFCYLVSPAAGLSLLPIDIFAQFTSYPLTVIPMFVLMGSLAFAAGIGKKLYDTAYVILGQLPGGLAIASVVASAGFGAICGSSAATCATVGKIALPEMKKYNYSDTLATGTVSAAGGLGILIPPSSAFIVYGILTEQSIGKLFISGIVPGIIIAVLFIATLLFLCRRAPAIAPPGVPTTGNQKIRSLIGLIDVLILAFIVLGGLFLGWFSPTQAGAIGCAGVLSIGLVRSELTWRRFFKAAKDAVRTSCMILLLITGAIIFGHFMVASTIALSLVDFVGSLPVSPIVTIGVICVIFFVLGCFVDMMALLVLLVPIFFPLVLALGFDPIWFGVIIVVLGMIGVTTPPVGVNVYVIKGIAKEVPLQTVFRGILPFLVPLAVALALLIVFPQIATFLPSLISY